MPPTLWYQSDVDTADLISMFTTRQADWAGIRNKISGFMFFHENVVDVPAGNWPYLNTNTYAALRDAGVFAQLKAWNIPIGFGPAGTDYTPAHDGSALAASLDSLALMAANGTPMSIIDVDTPRGRGMGNGWTEDETVSAFQDYVEGVRAAYPSIQLGEVEAFYTVGASAVMQTWITKCRTAGFFVDWLSCDVGWHLGQTIVDEVVDFLAWAQALSPPLPVQIIIMPGYQVSESPDDATYVITAHNALDLAFNNLAGSDLRAIEAMSWYYRGASANNIRDIPLNLPEDNAWASHTWLTAEIAARYSIPDAVRGLSGFSHIDGITAEPLVGLYRDAGGLLVEPAGSLYELVTGSVTPVLSYPLLTRIESPAWRGTWRGHQRGNH